MGQSGSLRLMYGWSLDDEQSKEYNIGEGAISDLVDKHGLDDDCGGNVSSDWAEWVVGKEIGPWMMELGVMEINDDYGKVEDSVYEELKPHVEFFGREPRKYLVMSYG